MGSTNILDAIAAELEGNDLAAAVNVLIPRTPSSSADIVLAARPSLWKEHDTGLSAIEGIASRAEVTDVQFRGKGRRRKLNVRLRSQWVEELGEGLERGQADRLYVRDLASGSMTVDFCDPNATKAFHVGHLRNLAVGNAIACLGSSAGADVTTLTHVSDIGRAMGEAMAGYLVHSEGDSPESAKIKGDHLIGSCYSRYSVAVREQQGRDPVADPVLSEGAVSGDLAEEILSKWADGDTDTRELWHQIRSWVVEGHEQTLARLGIDFDRVLFESDYTSQIDRFVGNALEAEVAQRGADGSVGFPTGRKEYPYILLLRADGQSTQYLRCVAMWHATRDQLGSSRSIQVMGDEWLAFELYGREMLSRIDSGAAPHPGAFVVHGMVLADEGKVSSSGDGDAWLVDDLLDQLAVDPRLERLATGDTAMSPTEGAALVALAFFLAHPVSKPMAASPGQLFENHSNPGWTLVEAWARAWDSCNDGDADPDAEDPDYRFLLLQAQLHRRFVAEALEHLDVQPLLRFHAHLSGWFLHTPPSPRLGRAMRAVLREGMLALGLMPQRSQ